MKHATEAQLEYRSKFVEHARMVIRKKVKDYLRKQEIRESQIMRILTAESQFRHCPPKYRICLDISRRMMP